MKNILEIFTDGGSKGNPGPGSIGIVIYKNKKKVFSLHQDIGWVTNNEAEYKALIKALMIIKEKKNQLGSIEKIIFYSDSRLLVNQVNGFFKVKQGKIKEYILMIRELEMAINLPIVYRLIPREENKEADQLVNQS